MIVDIRQFYFNRTPWQALKYAIQEFLPQGYNIGIEHDIVQTEELVLGPPEMFTQAGMCGGLIATGQPGRGISGPRLTYQGPAGGVMLTLRGANQFRIQGLGFRTEGLAKGAVFIDEANSTPGWPGSSGVSLMDCMVDGGVGADSFCLKVGHNNYQASEVLLHNTFLRGYSNQTKYGMVTATANTKNFVLVGGGINNCDYGLCHGTPGSFGGSGYMTWYGANLSNNRVSDIWSQTGNTLSIFGGGSESSARFIDCAGSSGGSHKVTAQNFYWDSPNVPTDDQVVKVSGQLYLQGCCFRNTRGGDIFESKICIQNQIHANSGAPNGVGSITSDSNTYSNSTRFAPFYDGSGAHLINSPQNSNYRGGRVFVSSRNDKGGNMSTGLLVPLSAIHGDPAVCSKYLMFEDATAVPGVQYLASGEGSPPRHAVSVTHEAFSASANQQNRRLWTLRKGHRLVDLVARVARGFVGPNTIVFRVGMGNGGDQFLLQFNAKVAGSYGVLQSDFGLALYEGTGYLNMEADTQIHLTMLTDSAIGNGTVSNLSDGVLELYAVTQFLG